MIADRTGKAIRLSVRLGDFGCASFFGAESAVGTSANLSQSRDLEAGVLEIKGEALTGLFWVYKKCRENPATSVRG
ncbi:hypothetical protein QUB47_29360 [Microcoleus sp. AT9_B5]